MDVKLTISFGEKLLEKLHDVLLENGIGALWLGKARLKNFVALQEIERRKLLGAAQLEKDVNDLKVGLKLLSVDGITLIDAKPELIEVKDALNVESIKQLANGNDYRDGIRRELNAAKAIFVAESILISESKDPYQDKGINDDIKVESDWIHRWRDYASQVSQESLQVLWGKVLAGEIKQPGSVSFRTLELIKTLSKDDAVIIGKIMSLAINNSFIFRIEEWVQSPDYYTYSELLHLSSLGLLQGVESGMMEMNYNYNEDDDDIHFISHGNMILTRTKKGNKSRTLTLPAYCFTVVGVQVCRIGVYEANIDYLKYITKWIKHRGFEPMLMRYKWMGENDLRFYNVDTGEPIPIVINEEEETK